MRFQGRLWKDGSIWLAEIPLLDVMTQGRTKKQVLTMVEDLLVSLVNISDFKITAHPGRGHDFEVSASSTRAVVGLLLRRQRARSGLTLAQVAERLGALFARWVRTVRTGLLSTHAGQAQRVA